MIVYEPFRWRSSLAQRGVCFADPSGKLVELPVFRISAYAGLLLPRNLRQRSWSFRMILLYTC